MEMRAVKMQDADGNMTLGYSLQVYRNQGTTFDLRQVGAFPDLGSANTVGELLGSAEGITYNATNHEPFSV